MEIEYSGWFFLAFHDPNENQFLGAVVVEGPGFYDAITNALLKGCNPGGDIKGVKIPASIGLPASDYRNRLLTREEVDCLYPSEPENIN